MHGRMVQAIRGLPKLLQRAGNGQLNDPGEVFALPAARPTTFPGLRYLGRSHPFAQVSRKQSFARCGNAFKRRFAVTQICAVFRYFGKQKGKSPLAR